MKTVYAPDTIDKILDTIHTYAVTPLLAIFGAVVVAAIFATLTEDWF